MSQNEPQEEQQEDPAQSDQCRVFMENAQGLTHMQFLIMREVVCYAKPYPTIAAELDEPTQKVRHEHIGAATILYRNLIDRIIDIEKGQRQAQAQAKQPEKKSPGRPRKQ
jgi:hypothetical protein